MPCLRCVSWPCLLRLGQARKAPREIIFFMNLFAYTPQFPRHNACHLSPPAWNDTCSNINPTTAESHAVTPQSNPPHTFLQPISSTSSLKLQSILSQHQPPLPNKRTRRSKTRKKGKEKKSKAGFGDCEAIEFKHKKKE
ncbi:hypothetical protein F4678DRAFT_449651 [Xylaria arbuscula]|nr:hypothetical protein F4678DRAFT_449651 [Xylaria arbuscula]